MLLTLEEPVGPQKLAVEPSQQKPVVEPLQQKPVVEPRKPLLLRLEEPVEQPVGRRKHSLLRLESLLAGQRTPEELPVELPVEPQKH